ncbi:Cys-tRNA(Pro) deacylase [Vreelandella populi]|uniref:Cys-tRNA(Pro)/Cys-tRNA(Cys) deacylase n=1 Tax=Vreelandella populi TaxID=2498858 RepID=A0A3S0X3E6_9GAMM|nr:Cys-tRNA(Pro) deacylase [Halomonas populi]RUR37897.1 Cys-tRNA(Pro) deacylase [Halomonas populi]RUR48875.1 Cys-tRNA(Pro) deacylase [Halomonas populi]RUR55219.1 Cys-tRNA(Pro) deacylase [Halomonas populi]
MTPAINTAKKAGILFEIHEYHHDAAAESYGLEAAEKLGVAAEKVFKTLVVTLDGKALAVGIVPVTMQLGLKQIAKAAGAKKAVMGVPAEVERATGYVLGGVSPLGQKKRLATYIDASAASFDTIFVSAGRRGLEIELAPSDLATLCKANFAPLAV